MALRVLLADESSSIKKVMQLALQDFGVEVKAVPVGLDVAPVCKSWMPDIIFADVLLTKKTGYDVSAELKNDAQLKHIPVVLMWSGFMEIDEAKARSSGADRRLEKPFDADTLRGIVRELVPNTSTNNIANFLSFPNLPDFVEQKPATIPATPVPPAKPTEPTPQYAEPKRSTPTTKQIPPAVSTPMPADAIETEEPNFSLNVALEPTAFEVDEPEDFTQIPLPKSKPTPLGSPLPHERESWSTGNLDRFKIQLPTDDFVIEDVKLQDLESAPIELTGAGEIALGELDGNYQAPATNPYNSARQTSPTANSMAAVPQIDPAQLEQLLRDQVRAVLQDIAWKIVPDITERIVREEIQKLLKEADKLG